jgi:hypothetical protein
MLGAAWVRDIAGELFVDAVVQYVQLWAQLQGLELDSDSGEDSIAWKWTSDGAFSLRTAYKAFFHGRTALPGAEQVWQPFALFKFQFHAWLALRNRCWTAEQLARRGLLTHAICPLCAAVGETMDHLSLQSPSLSWFGRRRASVFSLACSHRCYRAR